MTDIPKSAFDATDEIAATLRSTNDIELTDADKTEIALIIAEPINVILGKLEELKAGWEVATNPDDIENCYNYLEAIIRELKGDDNG